MKKALLLSLSLLFIQSCAFIQERERPVEPEPPVPSKSSAGLDKVAEGKNKGKKVNEESSSVDLDVSRLTEDISPPAEDNSEVEESDIIDELLKEIEIKSSNGEQPVEELTFPELIEDILDVRSVDSVKPDIWPVMGFVTSRFGWRKRGRRTKKFHAGIDISAPYGSPVVATSAGKVIYAGWIRGYGNVAIIYHGYGFTTLYAHMSSLAVRNKDYVIKGQVIGYVGRTGRATGSHLHYEVLKYGIRQNPILFLP